MTINVFDPDGSEAVLIEKLLASSYETVKYVVSNIALLRSIATNMEPLLTLSDALPDVGAVEAAIVEINAVAAALSDVIAVSDGIAGVTDVAANLTALLAVEAALPSLASITSSLSTIVSIAPHLTAIDQVNVIRADVAAVSANLGMLSTVSANLSSIIAALSGVNAAMDLRIATVPEAQAGASNTVFSTPLRVAQQITSRVGTAANTIAAGDDSRFTRSLGSRAILAATAIAAGLTVIRVDGYADSRDNGGGTMVKLVSAPVPAKNWHTQSFDGAWWELREFSPSPHQFGALGNGAANDSAASQFWLDYLAAFNVQGLVKPGIYVIPSETLNVASNVSFAGTGRSTVFRRTTEVVAPLFKMLSVNHARISNIALECTTNLTSLSSVVVGTGSKTFTVAAGETWTPGMGIHVYNSAAPNTYMVGTVTSYTGTTLVINAAAWGGTAGTYATWGLVAAGSEACAVLIQSGNNCSVRDCLVTGRFYIGLQTLNSNGTRFLDNTLTGAVNRNIYIYGASGTDDDCLVQGNNIEGGGLSDYGINANGSTGGAITNLRVIGNTIEGTLAQGVGIGGSCTHYSVLGNTLQNLSGFATAILIGYANGNAMQNGTVANNTVINCNTGVDLLSANTVIITGNVIDSVTIGIRIRRLTSSVALDNIVSNNIVKNYTLWGISFESDAASQCGVSICSNNRVVGSGGATIGIVSDVNTTHISFVGNISTGNATANYNTFGVSGGTTHAVSGNL